MAILPIPRKHSCWWKSARFFGSEGDPACPGSSLAPAHPPVIRSCFAHGYLVARFYSSDRAKSPKLLRVMSWREHLMKLERIDLYQLSMPLLTPFATWFFSGSTEYPECILVEIHTDGLTGYGECAADRDPGYSYRRPARPGTSVSEFLIRGGPGGGHQGPEDFAAPDGFRCGGIRWLRPDWKWPYGICWVKPKADRCGRPVRGGEGTCGGRGVSRTASQPRGTCELCGAVFSPRLPTGQDQDQTGAGCG